MSHQDLMNAIEISENGPPEVLKLGQRPVPRPGSGEVLIKVAAAGVNRVDCMQRAGKYPPPEGTSDIPGLELAGEIVSVGKGVDSTTIGKMVMALVAGGAYAEFATAALDNTLPIPAGLSITEAASVPETFFTVWHNVFQRGQLKSGETFLVHGGTSGIGTTAIQLAKSFGASVIATAGTEEKCDACRKLGADHAINYHETPFEERVLEITGGRGCDVILDMVGGAYVARNFKAAANEGRIVQIATMEGFRSEINLLPVMLKRLTYTGSTMRTRSVEFKSVIVKELTGQVWPLLEAGEVKVVMDSEFELVAASKAHARMESGRHIGKIVLKV